MECIFCREKSRSSYRCTKGHYVCDRCYRMGAEDLIEYTTTRSTSDNPFIIAEPLLEAPVIRLHGPEHHFLVPAVLIAALYNHTRQQDRKERCIRAARRRADLVKGGFCGMMGDCGAALGTGIFVSVIAGATPMSQEEWRLSNLVTGRTLEEIALYGGPRCCKRNTFLALRSAVRFLEKEMHIRLPMPETIRCRFGARSQDCVREKCPFYTGS